MNLVRTFRPRRFQGSSGDIGVLGQPEAVSALIREVRTRRGRSILLQGPHLSGKETLGLIYANALLCPRSSDGDPCLDKVACASCRDFAERDHCNFHHVACDDSEDNIAVKLNARTEIEYISDGWTVVLIIDADTLSDRSLELLRRRLKIAPAKHTFVVCTSYPDRLPETIRSGLLEVKTKSVSVPLRLSLLDDICKRRCADPAYRAEPGALELLAEHSEPTFGHVLNGLQAVLSEEGVTLARVRAHFRLDGNLWGARYLSALLDGESLEAQMRILTVWDASPGERIAAIEALLAALFSADVEHMSDHHACLAALTIVQRTQIVAGLTRCTEALGFEPQRFWPLLVGIWRPDPAARDATLLARAAEFRNFLSPEKGTPVRSRTALRGESVRRRVRRSGDEAGISVETHVYLSRRQVEDLWNAASFALQKSGTYLNTYMVLDHDALGIDGEIAAQALVTDLLSQLRDRMRSRKNRQGGNSGLYWLYVHERQTGGRLRTCIALHLPKTMRNADAWLRTGVLASHAGGPVNGSALVVRHGRTSEVKPLRRHLTLLRLLVRGLDPDVKVVVDRSGVQQERGLVDVIRVPRMLRCGIGALAKIRRLETSRHCARTARSEETAKGLPFVSAFDEQVWSATARGYDSEEWRARAIAAEQLAAIQRDFPNDSSPEWLAKRSAREKQIRHRYVRAAKARLRECDEHVIPAKRTSPDLN